MSLEKLQLDVKYSRDFMQQQPIHDSDLKINQNIQILT